MNDDNRFGFFGGKGSIEALRDVGYKDVGMAMSEIIDNSIQAQAKNITIVLTITTARKKINNVKVIKEIAIIDDGCGMDEILLRNALRLGEGTHKDDECGTGKIGKFGMGLPQSSISYCKRVDVWSWQNTPSSKKHAFIDLDDDEWVENACIEAPDDKSIPKKYNQFLNNNISGTIVQWSNIDKDLPRENTLFNEVEDQIGRIYRYWLHNNQVSIRMVSLNLDGEIDPKNDYYFRPVDPLFLMEDGKTSKKAGYVPPCVPMFVPYGDEETKLEYKLEDGTTATVTLKYSIAKYPDVWPSKGDKAPGSLDHGKFADDNKGVSLLREMRELEFYDDWAFPKDKDSRSRWWGMEINFPHSMDQIFGVTNSKQYATELNKIARKTNEEIKKRYSLDGLEESDLQELKESNYSAYVRISLVAEVNRIIKNMYDQIESTKYKDRNEASPPTVEIHSEIYTNGVGTIDYGKGESDDSENDYDSLKETIVNDPSINDSTKETLLSAILNNQKCAYCPQPDGGSSFFDTKRSGPVVLIMPNVSHPIYKHLYGPMEELETSLDPYDEKDQKMLEIIQYSKLLLTGWGRLEDEARESRHKEDLQMMREDWGRKIGKWIREFENKE